MKRLTITLVIKDERKYLDMIEKIAKIFDIKIGMQIRGNEEYIDIERIEFLP